MYGNVALELPSASGLVIPAEALVDTGEHQYVFVAKEAGRFEPRLVHVGGRASERVQISESLAAGEVARHHRELPHRLREPATRGDRKAGELVMVERIIELCARNRVLVLVAVGLAVVGAMVAMKRAKLDAIPDLSDPQDIVFSEWMGRSPTLVEDQVTYPIVSKLIGTPHVSDVRGFSMFGMSFVYVVFEEGTDIYWARSRVLE